MKLALVTPGTRQSGFPLGFLNLHAWLKRYAPSWEVRIIDGNHENPLPILLKEPFDVIGLTAMSEQYEDATKLARLLKAGRKGPVIIGGNHITSCPGSLRSCFDKAIIGEAENALLEYLGEGNNQPVNLSNYPDLDYGLMNADYFKPRPMAIYRRNVVSAILMGSRGCPYNCRFCSATNLWQNRYRAFEPEWIIRQLQRMAELGITHVHIWDDLFTLNKTRLLDIAIEFHKADLGKVIKGIAVQSCADHIDSETYSYLRAMKVQFVTFGFESGNDRILKLLKGSRITKQVNQNAVLKVKEYGLNVTASFIVGNPTETFREMLQTVWFMVWCWIHGCEELLVYGLVVYPATDFWQEAKKRGLVSDDMPNWNVLNMHHKLVCPKPILCDIPRWQFVIVWYLAQLCLMPFRIKKAWRILKTRIKH